MRRTHALPRLVATLSIASGCASAPTREAPPPAPPAPPPAPAAPADPVSGARWLVHHPEALAPAASYPLPGGGTLHASNDGQRWVTAAGAAGEAADGGIADGGVASTEPPRVVLPEPIAAIQPVEGRWAFFGASGRSFVTGTPLGPIEEIRPALAPVLSVSRGRGAVFAVTRRGDVVRTSDGGAHWAPLPAPASWPSTPIAAAFRTDGTGVALCAPQRAFVTTDDGASWAPLSIPGPGPHAVAVLEDGDIWLGSNSDNLEYRLSGRPPAFVKAKPVAQNRQREDDDARYQQYAIERGILGRRVVSLVHPGPEAPVRIKVSELDGESEWKDAPSFKGCDWLAVAASDEDFVVGCSRGVLDPDAPQRGPASFRAALYRSKDGVSWTEEGDLPLRQGRLSVAAGPGGSILVQAWCSDGEAGCTPLFFRSAAGRPLAPLPVPKGANVAAIAIDPVHKVPLAVLRSEDYGQPGAKPQRLLRWAPDGTAAGVTDLPWLVDDPTGFGVDAHGTALLVAGVAPGNDQRILRVPRDGSMIEQVALPSPDYIADAAFSGDRGLLLQEGQYWETADGGKDWTRVGGIVTSGIACSSEGCLVGPERRVGWDLSPSGAPAVPDPPPPAKVAGAPPLRCTGAGASEKIPRVMVSGVDELARGWDGARLTVPTTTKDHAVGVTAATLSGDRPALKTTSLLGAAPNPAAVGSQTDVQPTPSGVIATRATYPVDRSEADVWISPVTLEVAWWRPETQKVERARILVPGKGQMRGKHQLQQGSGRAEILWLTPEAAYFRPRAKPEDASQILAFAAGGRSTKTSSAQMQSASMAARTASGLALIEHPSPSPWDSETTIVFEIVGSPDGHFDWTLAPPRSGATIVPLARGDDAAMVVAWSGPPDGPPRGYLVALRPGDDPKETTDLGLAALLGEHPRACTGATPPGSVRFQVDLPRAMRRPVLIEGDPPALLQASSALVVVPPQGSPCVSAWIAHGEDDGAIIPIAAPAQAVSVAMPHKGILWEKDLTLRALRCEEAPGLSIPASFGWKGF